MVVGAYTIINTIGLLVGLPYNYAAEDEIQLNNSLPNYCIKENITTTNINSLYLIFEGSISEGAIVNNSSISLRYNFKFNGIYDISFTYTNKIDNYYIFTYSEHNTGGSEKDYNYCYLRYDIDFNFKQAYFGRLTSSLSPIDGDNIISSITSGLGLIGDITTNFKNGFSALIWNSEKNTLTTFGNFALIFLGVSITFAIIKLCLNLIRSKTGA